MNTEIAERREPATFSRLTSAAELWRQDMDDMREGIMSKWLPIETAPKDGTLVDLWSVENDRGSRYVDLYWNDHECCWQDEHGQYSSDWFDGIFTHWMLSPEPPEES